MKGTLRQVLAELPEIRQQARFAGKAFEFGKWVGRDYVTELKLCDAIQAAAEEIERLNGVLEQKEDTMQSRCRELIRVHEENQRLQAWNEQLNTRLKEAESVIAQVRVYLDMISELQREGGKRG